MVSKISIFLIICFLIPCFVQASALKRKPSFSLRVYPEELQSTQENVPANEPGTSQKYVRTTPLLTEHDIKAASPFSLPSATGDQGGAYFRLDERGTRALAEYSLERSETILRVNVNGHHVDDVFIKGPITDGVFVVSHGLTEAERDALKANFPPLEK